MRRDALGKGAVGSSSDPHGRVTGPVSWGLPEKPKHMYAGHTNTDFFSFERERAVNPGVFEND